MNRPRSWSVGALRGPALALPGALLGLSLLSPPPARALPDHTTYDIVLGQTRLGYRRPNGTDPRSFSSPMAVAVDRTRQPGHLYVADSRNGRVLGWRDATSFRNGAPADLVIGQPDGESGERYRADAASLSRPTGLAVDKDGTLWVSDADNGRILGFRWPFDPAQKHEDNITADFLLGQPEFGLGYALRTCNGKTLAMGQGSPATDQTLCEPMGLGTDPVGNLYVADRLNHRVLVFRAPIPDRYAKARYVFGHDTANGPSRCNRSAAPVAPDARALCGPQDLYVDARETPLRLYVADTDNNRVLVFDNPLADQVADRVIGQASMAENGAGAGMDRLNRPAGVTLDGAGHVWVSDTGNHRMLGFVPPFAMTLPVASFVIGQIDGNGTQANQGIPGRLVPTPTATTLFSPSGATVDDRGRLLVADGGNHRVLAYAQPARVNAVATSVLGQPDFVHGAESRAEAGSLAYPVGLAVDRPDPRLRPGEPQAVYVVDFGNSRVLGWRDLYALRSGKPADLVLGQKGLLDHACNQGRGVSPTALCWPRGVAVDKAGDVWVADTWNHRVLRFRKPFAQKGEQAADLVLGQPSFIAGLPNVNGTPQPSQRSLFSPVAVAVEEGGVVWVADRDNNRVLGFAPPLRSGMEASYVLVGEDLGVTDVGCPRGGGGYLCAPMALAVDPAGGIWVADRDNNRVALYQARPSKPETPLISPVPQAVIGQPSITANAPNNGDPEKPTQSSLMFPEGVAVETGTAQDGKPVATAIVVADSGNHRVLVFDPLTTGFQPTAKQVYGQEDAYDRRSPNIDADYFDRASNVERGLFNPAAVVALPEALLIADSGDTSRLSAKLGHVQPPLTDTGNSRVLLIKGPGFPEPMAADMAAPPDLTEPDMRTDPMPTGCSCDLGRGGGRGLPAAGLGLAVGALLLARRRQRR